MSETSPVLSAGPHYCCSCIEDASLQVGASLENLGAALIAAWALHDEYHEGPWRTCQHPACKHVDSGTMRRLSGPAPALFP